ncbi:MAG: hypothetical protein K2Y39_27635 [Candidatus Obscuribacterales bacterium]|nr:hypothetical protein [Candidatus Obscuribacterales bacterium]
MTSPMFSKSNFLFPQESTQQAPEQVSPWHTDVYSGSVSPHKSSTLPPGVLPDIIVSGSDDANVSSITTQEGAIGSPLNRRNTSSDVTLNITKDTVFDQPLTSDPEVVDRAARALVRDTEGMLLYLALMKTDSEQFQKVSDQQTSAALKIAVASQTNAMQERVVKRLRDMNISNESAAQAMEFLQVFTQAIFKDNNSSGSSAKASSAYDSTGLSTSANNRAESQFK